MGRRSHMNIGLPAAAPTEAAPLPDVAVALPLEEGAGMSSAGDSAL
jgi:hypothetical protein